MTAFLHSYSLSLFLMGMDIDFFPPLWTHIKILYLRIEVLWTLVVDDKNAQAMTLSKIIIIIIL